LSGLTTWFVLSWYWGGAINIQTTQQQLPGLYGAIVSFFSPALFSVAISLAKPSTFDWRIFLKLDLITEKSAQQSPAISATQSSTDVTASSDISENEKNTTQISSDHEKPSPSTALTTEPPAHDLDNVVHPMSPETLRHVRKWLRIASIFFVVNVVTTLILWPLPLYRDYIFTRSFFGGWVTVAIIWHFAAMGAVIVYPCFDGRHAIATSVKGVVGEIRALMGRGRVKA
jgi:urea-proton symporter